MIPWDDIKQLHEIVDLPRIMEDDIIPDTAVHVVMILNPDLNSSQPYIPIVVTGAQWDMLWWIWRLEYEDIMHLVPFNEFVTDFMSEKYNEYVAKKRRFKDK